MVLAPSNLILNNDSVNLCIRSVARSIFTGNSISGYLTLFLQGNTHYRIVVARVVIVQSRERVIVLAREAFGGAQRPLVVALLAIGTIHLVTLDGCTACRVAQAGQHAAQRVGLVEAGARPIRFAQQVPGQRVVVGVALVAASAGVVVFLLIYL